MENQLVQYHPEYNQYPDIIIVDQHNPTVRAPKAVLDLMFNQTRETLSDPDTFKSFIKSSERAFRASREYKAYKSYLMDTLGLDRCQILGNVTNEDADIELHHNVLGLFDIATMITLHYVNTVGCINSMQLIQLLIKEHYQNNVGVTFLSKTAHQLYTADVNGFINSGQTFGSWWNLLGIYKYGITFDIAYKVINYLKKYQNQMPVSINMEQQEEILSWASYNTYGEPMQNLPAVYTQTQQGDMYEYY